jgi:hypothetical protein
VYSPTGPASDVRGSISLEESFSTADGRGTARLVQVASSDELARVNASRKRSALHEGCMSHTKDEEGEASGCLSANHAKGLARAKPCPKGKGVVHKSSRWTSRIVRASLHHPIFTISIFRGHFLGAVVRETGSFNALITRVMVWDCLGVRALEWRQNLDLNLNYEHSAGVSA